MAPRGFSLISFTYSRFISALCEVKNFHLIEVLLEDMEKLGSIPDIWAYNIYLNLLCQENQIDAALGILQFTGHD